MMEEVRDALQVQDTGTTDAASFSASPAMLIIVGPERKQFWLHRDLLRSESDFFRGCFRGGFREAQDNRVEFLDDNIEAFSAIVDWLHDRKINAASEKYNFSVLVEAYIIAERLLMTRCQNSITDAIRSFHREDAFGTDDLKALFKFKVNENSPIFRYYVDEYSYSLQAFPDEHLERLPGVLSPYQSQLFFEGGSFPMRVVQRIFADLTSEHYAQSLPTRLEPSELAGCRYHVHTYSSDSCGLEEEA